MAFEDEEAAMGHKVGSQLLWLQEGPEEWEDVQCHYSFRVSEGQPRDQERDEGNQENRDRGEMS